MNIYPARFIITLLFIGMLILGGCGSIEKSEIGRYSPLQSGAKHVETGTDSETAAPPNEIRASTEEEEQQRQAEEKRLFDQVYREQEEAATGWTESELKALAELPPDHKPRERTAEEQAETDAIEQAMVQVLNEKYEMDIYPNTGEKFWSGRAYSGMGHILANAVDDPRKAGSFIRFPTEDRFLTSLAFVDKAELAHDAVIIVQAAFKHLPTIQHVDLRIYHNAPDYMTGEEYGTFTIPRDDFEAVIDDSSLTNEQRFERAFKEDDFDAR